MTQLTAETVLNMRFISYATPLELARRWSQSDERSEREQALKLLIGLFRDFPHSIEIGQQLALAYLEAGDEPGAMLVLQDLRLLCRNPNEEVLCRCGRVYRDRGDHYVTYSQFAGASEIRVGGPVEVAAAALRYYALALLEYDKAYQIRLGHYPGVNVATLHLLIAAFESNDAVRDKHSDECKNIAQHLLARKEAWPSEHDDDPIWHSASAGEIHLLLQEWQQADVCYRQAQEHKQFQTFHRTTMLRQVIRIVYAHKRLGVPSLGPFDDLANVFGS